MAKNLAGAEHRDIMALLRNYADPDDESKYYTAPSASSCETVGGVWHDAGQAADDVATAIQNALQKLMQDGNGWKGKAADEFKKKADEIIWFAREIAHMCDDSFQKPDPPQDSDSGPFATPTADGGGSGGYKQKFEDLKRALENIEGENANEKLPLPPWWESGSNWWVKWYVSAMSLGMGSVTYEIRNDGSGSRTGVVKGDIDNAEMEGKIDSLHVPWETSEDGLRSGRRITTYEGHEKIFLEYRMNEEEEQTSQGTAQDLVTAYGEVSGAFPPAPQAPQLGEGAGAGAGGGGGAGAGAGAGGGMPGGAGGGMPGGAGGSPPFTKPEVPEPPTSDPPKPPDTPQPPDTDQPQPPDWQNRPPEWDPNDPQLPDKDGDGTPDWKDPFPNDPSRGGDGWSGGSTKPGDIDVGADAARAGGFGGGAGGIGGGVGGMGGGVGAGAGGTVGAGAGLGAGAGAGAGGAFGAAGSAGGGFAGGMMPMGAGMGGGPQGQDDGIEQQRNTWLEEDEDVWGADDDAPPPVIGG